MGLLSSRPCLPVFSIPAGSTAGPPLLFLSCRKFRMAGSPWAGWREGLEWLGWFPSQPQSATWWPAHTGKNTCWLEGAGAGVDGSETVQLAQSTDRASPRGQHFPCDSAQQPRMRALKPDCLGPNPTCTPYYLGTLGKLPKFSALQGSYLQTGIT